MALVYNGAVSRAGAPAPGYLAALLAIPGALHVFDAEHVTLSGSDIATMTDLSGSGQTLVFPSGQRPALISDALSGRPVARFSRSDQDTGTLSGDQPDLAAAYTRVLVFKPSTPSADWTIDGRYTDASNQDTFRWANAAAKWRHRRGTTDFDIEGIVPDRWNTVMLGFDGTNVRDRANTTSMTTQASSGAVGSGAYRIATTNSAAQAPEMDLAMVAVFEACIVNDADALAAVAAYVGVKYGLPL